MQSANTKNPIAKKNSPVGVTRLIPPGRAAHSDGYIATSPARRSRPACRAPASIQEFPRSIANSVPSREWRIGRRIRALDSIDLAMCTQERHIHIGYWILPGTCLHAWPAPRVTCNWQFSTSAICALRTNMTDDEPIFKHPPSGQAHGATPTTATGPRRYLLVLQGELRSQRNFAPTSFRGATRRDLQPSSWRFRLDGLSW